MINEELFNIIAEPKRANYFIAGKVNFHNQTLTLYRGNIQKLDIPFDYFKVKEDCAPDFNQFSIIDYGQTIKLGEYKIASDTLLKSYSLYRYSYINFNDLEELKKLYKETTEGIWEPLGNFYDGDKVDIVIDDPPFHGLHKTIAECVDVLDAHFICAVHKVLPDLFERLDLMQRELNNTRENADIYRKKVFELEENNIKLKTQLNNKK